MPDPGSPSPSLPRRAAAAFRRWFLGDTLWKASRPVPLERFVSNPTNLAIKCLGYHLAREHAPVLAGVDASGEPRHHGLVSKACTQRDIESPWFVHWCRALHIDPAYDRKLWEYALLLQVLHERGLLREGSRGLGFGCGEEPIASFLASRGVAATATDLDPSLAAGTGWMETGQHATRRDLTFRPELVTREAFDRLVDFAFVDMRAISADLDGRYDFCWSLCALEHLGSIDAGLRFVEESLRSLRPGGLAVHTTEFNFLGDRETLESGPTVLYLARHLREFVERLSRKGHRVAPLDLDVGAGVVDRYVDVPPHPRDPLPQPGWNQGSVTLKLALDGFATTSIALVVEKG